MSFSVWIGILIPLAGTALGAALVYFMKQDFSVKTRALLCGFAAGVMTAASVWSLLIPSLEQSNIEGFFSFAPAFFGFWLGVGFLLLLDVITPHMHRLANGNENEGPRTSLSDDLKLLLAVTIHNIPEGMAVGVVFAGMIIAGGNVGLSAALSLSLGIALQNIPEGAIISMPLYASGMSRNKSFLFGTLSGAVEPAASLITLLFIQWIAPSLSWFLSFAAGAMLYVVVEELIPEMSEGSHSNLPVLCFMFGFSLMMVLDVVFA